MGDREGRMDLVLLIVEAGSWGLRFRYARLLAFVVTEHFHNFHPVFPAPLTEETVYSIVYSGILHHILGDIGMWVYLWALSFPLI